VKVYCIEEFGCNKVLVEPAANFSLQEFDKLKFVLQVS